VKGRSNTAFRRNGRGVPKRGLVMVEAKDVVVALNNLTEVLTAFGHVLLAAILPTLIIYGFVFLLRSGKYGKPLADWVLHTTCAFGSRATSKPEPLPAPARRKPKKR
jgi:hypothetical protein